MKPLQGNLISVFLIIVFGMALLTNTTHAEDGPLPPEVKKLIGVKIPPKIVKERGGDIPDFIQFGSGMLDKKIGHDTPRAELGFDEGIIGGKWPVFIVSAVHNDKTLEILDVHLLPKKMINWRYAKGNIRRLETGNFLIFSTGCHYSDSSSQPIDDDRIIFGLEDPKAEYEGYSTRIERAWEIDPQSGRIKAIQTQGIICAILGE